MINFALRVFHPGQTLLLMFRLWCEISTAYNTFVAAT